MPALSKEWKHINRIRSMVARKAPVKQVIAELDVLQVEGECSRIELRAALELAEEGERGIELPGGGYSAILSEGLNAMRKVLGPR